MSTVQISNRNATDSVSMRVRLRPNGTPSHIIQRSGLDVRYYFDPSNPPYTHLTVPINGADVVIGSVGNLVNTSDTRIGVVVISTVLPTNCLIDVEILVQGTVVHTTTVPVPQDFGAGIWLNDVVDYV